MQSQILGGYDVGRSISLTDNLLINLYLELAQSEGAETGALYMCPGKSLFATLGQGPIRGMIVKAGPQLYVVSGAAVYVIQTNGYVQYLGPIASNSGPVSMITNGTQVAFFDGVTGYLIGSGNHLSRLSLPFAGPLSASYQDGFGLVSQLNSQVMWQSASFDLSTWGALAFSSADGTPDNIVAIHENHREQWVFKDGHIEVYVDAGTSGFAFERLDGVFPESGCAATFSVAKQGDNLIWLESSSRGTGRVVMSNGYNVVALSNHSITRIIQSFPVISDAVAYCYEEDGHTFYVISFPTANRCFACDISESMTAKTPLWHERAYFNGGVFSRDLGATHVLFNGQHIVGDWSSGNLYVQSLGTQLDNGQQRKWLRTWRALPKETEEPVSFRSLEIRMQTGVGIAQGVQPSIMLRWSDDGGYSWSGQRIKQCGPAGATSQRVKFNALGGTARGTGMDRIWELSSTDPASWAIMGAYQDVSR